MADEGFREIQLSGKQLIALFMTAAVVLIATFLCGVLVGRGVRAQQEPSTSAASVQAAPGAVDPTASTAGQKLAPPSEQSGPQAPPATPPPQTEEDPTLYGRGQAKPAPAAAPAVATSEAKPKDPPGPAAAPAPGEPAGTGFYVKVVAYNGKAQADKVSAQLSARGYSAYVVPVTGKGKVLYSVRVGKFATRKEADAAKRRLEEEEQFKPSIAR
jgi:cell division protein FtsN